jgi:hypothetical protein
LNSIKIAIHHNIHSASERWIEYCEQNKIPFKLVDCTSSDIIGQLKDCDGLMWHWGQTDYKSQLFARQLTYSLEKMGKKVYPNSASCWHFDDKVGQKYLLQSLNIPLVPSHVFYTKKEAIEWLKVATFPKVFKLRGGAGSTNVSLVRNRQQAIKKVNTAFGKGFPAISRWNVVKEKSRKLRLKKDMKSLSGLYKSIIRLILPAREKTLLSREKGYVYFQDFIPNNNYDTRLIVIGNKCFGTRRFVRKNDFRASGSGSVDDSPENINIDIVRKAFQISKLLNSQTLAFDFLEEKGNIKVIEISYGFPVIPSDGLPGYWDNELKWHEGLFKSQYWMVENFIKEIQESKTNI